MKRFFTTLLFSFFFFVGACSETEENSNVLRFGTNAIYPPFEYREQGELKGFDIDLGRLIATELGKVAVFEDMQFSAILPALQNGRIDAAIATLTITDARKKKFDFSTPYYFAGIAAVFKKEKSLHTVEDLRDKRVACELGSTMENWIKEQQIVPHAMDNNNQSIEALKADQIDVALMDEAQAVAFTQRNTGLTFHVMTRSVEGYGIAFQKDSPLLKEINHALRELEARGELTLLKQKWFQGVAYD